MLLVARDHTDLSFIRRVWVPTPTGDTSVSFTLVFFRSHTPPLA